MNYIDYIKKRNEIVEKVSKECLRKLKIVIFRSFTIETIEPILQVKLAEEGIYSKISIGGYNQYYQDIVNEESKYNNEDYDVCIIAVRLEELYPTLINNFLNEKENLIEIEQFILSQYKNMIETIKSNHSRVNILINNFILPYNNYASLYDYQNLDGQANYFRSLNYKLVKLASNYTGVYIVDFEAIASLLGKKNIEDRKMWYVAKNPYKYEFYVELAKVYVKYIKAIFGLRKKCIVLDLDNTLWGGIIGEDGINNIKLGDKYPGSCYKEFQRELLKLKNRGVILTICSKNNMEDVEEVFEKHPDMILRKEDFASIKVNWNDKYSNIKEISNELNIGMESMIFIDDSKIECELVRQNNKEIEVINISNNPMEYPDIIYKTNFFEIINITNEDLKKTDIYKAQINRNYLRENTSNLEDYYKSLQMKLTVKLLDNFAVARVSQLTQKTNQFNLRTIRYTEEDLKQMSETNEYEIYYASVVDRFGDNGISLCCILKKQNDDSIFIDSLLMSCRVMGRNIERAFMSYLCKKLKEDGKSILIGEYIPTKKNIPVKDFYKEVGFEKIDSGVYILDLKNKTIECPNYITIV